MEILETLDAVRAERKFRGVKRAAIVGQNALPLQVRPKDEKGASRKTSSYDPRSPRERKSSACSRTQPLSDLSVKKDILGRHSADRSSG